MLIEKLNENLKNADRANCFNAVELFFDESKLQKFTGPEEFVNYMSKSFQQLASNEELLAQDVLIVWSRSAPVLAVGEVSIADLAAKRAGYPFGLVIEHACVVIDKERVFEKPDPVLSSRYQLVSLDAALKPYLNRDGFELTRHRRN